MLDSPIVDPHQTWDYGAETYDDLMARVPTKARIDYRAFDHPGPVAEAFAASNAPIRAIMGPFGSGKTSEAINEHLTRAIRMPFFKETDERGRNYRIYKGLVVRSKYRDLYKTSIPSWWEWFPPEWGQWSGGQDRPARHVIEFEDQYGPIRMIMDFAAIGDANVEMFFKGYAVCGVQFEEMDGFQPEVIEFANGRVGRFPRKSDLLEPDVPFWRGVWGTLNACDFDHWFYEEFVETLLLDPTEAELLYLTKFNATLGLSVDRMRALFIQPSGLSPHAENLQNMPDGYYEQLAAGAKKDWVRKNVKNMFGYSRSGQPVYGDDFQDQFHFAPAPLEPVPGIPIDIAIDAGGHPSASFRQKMPDGQRRYLGEIVNEAGGCGPTRFSDQLLRFWERRFAGFRTGDLYGDPSMFYGGDEQTKRELSDLSFGNKVINLTGWRFRPAPSNEIVIRTDAVRDVLLDRIDNTRPMVLFCPTMKFARRAFNSKYNYPRDLKTGTVKNGRDPVKLPGFSDIMDCIQYCELSDIGLKTATARDSRRQMTAQNRQGRRHVRRAKPSGSASLNKGGFRVL